MRAIDLIQKKRDGVSLSSDDVHALIRAYTKNEIPDYQMTAFLMAVFFRGMTSAELNYFTNAMMHSGAIVDWSDLGQPCIDKHSTGGVGDKISIPLAPAVAACGVAVPMIAGRGLGHTGGTIDKLESISGFRTNLSLSEYKSQVKKISCCIIAQSTEIAPADKKLYALRDVTCTIDSVPLIASSIMSKKLAEGVSGLVLDVKFGSGAFMREQKDARILAQTMVEIGTGLGRNMVAYLTSMEQPIGIACGNALEIKESFAVLENQGPTDVIELVVEFGAEMLVLGGACKKLSSGREQIKTVLKNGQARNKMIEMIASQGGNPKVMDDPSLLAKAQKINHILAPRNAYLKGIDTKAIGLGIVALGGGRQVLTDQIDPGVGVEMAIRLGELAQQGQPLCYVHSNQKGEAEALNLIQSAFQWTDDPKEAAPPSLLTERISSDFNK